MGGAIGSQFGGIAKEINTKAEDTKICPNCKAVMPKGKRYCSDCGFDSLKETQKSEDKTIIICSKCGTKYKNSMKYCPECGDKYNPCPKCGSDLEEGATICKFCNYEFALLCPYCGKALPNKNVRFCPECGKSLTKTCPSCNAPITGSPKFCPECGNKLE